jgi:hypothetical protein
MVTLKRFVSDEFCTTYFLRFIVYDIGRNVVQESGRDQLLNFEISMNNGTEEFTQNRD